MSAIALGGANDPLLPQQPGGMAPGASLALIAHAALVAALVWGLNWRTQTPEVVSAELWAAVPQVAAPKAEEVPVVPPPAPPKPEPVQPKVEAPLPDPQIAIEREKKLQREREAREAREAREKKAAAEKAAAEKAAQQAAEARLAKQREENLKRMMGQAGASGAHPAGTAAQDAAPSRSYAGRLVAHIKPNIVFTESVSGNPAAEVEVRAAPSGTIVARRIARSSGNKEWDEAVLRAIDRTGTLPRDIDGRVPSTLLITFRPND